MVPITPRTAERAINLHRFRAKHSQLFAKIVPLGVSKAYVLIELTPARIKALTSKSHVVPSTGANKTLLAMTYGEMLEVIVSPSPSASPALITTARRSVRRLERDIDSLIEAGDAVDADEVAELYDEVVVALERLGKAFDFDY